MSSANVHFASRVAVQSLRVVLIFAGAVIAALVSERLIFQKNFSAISANLQAISRARSSILLADEKLTMSAVAYAQSSNQAWRSRYINAMPELSAAIAEAKTLATSEDAAVFDTAVSKAHADMASLEQLVLDLTENGERADAVNVFTSPRYVNNKRTIEAAVNELLAKTEGRAAADQQQAKTRTLLLLVTAILISAVGFMGLSRRLRVALGQAENAFEKSQDAYHQQLTENHESKLKTSRLEQLGSLVATVAHELRNPLGAVRTSTFLLNRNVPDQDEKVQRAFQRINTGIDRCDNIITQLLAFTHIKSSVTETVEFDTWLEGAVREMAKTLNASLELSCVLGAEGVKVALDMAQMHEALSRLLRNAAEALDHVQDARDGVIRIESRCKDGVLECYVSDNADGIAPDILPKILEPFFTTKSFGAGLGLPTAVRILEQHGGRLDISSTESTGTTVKFSLPAA